MMMTTINLKIESGRCGKITPSTFSTPTMNDEYLVNEIHLFAPQLPSVKAHENDSTKVKGKLEDFVFANKMNLARPAVLTQVQE